MARKQVSTSYVTSYDYHVNFGAKPFYPLLVKREFVTKMWRHFIKLSNYLHVKVVNNYNTNGISLGADGPVHDIKNNKLTVNKIGPQSNLKT